MTGTVARILYVDDDAALVRLVQKALGRRGIEVVHAPSADAGIECVVTSDFHAIALDHYLPTGTGLDFLQQLAAITEPPPVVYVTGSAEMDVAVAALKAGASDFVPKTVGDDFLVLLGAALEQAVERGRLRAEKEAAEREVRAARDRAEILLREVNHRVANSLSMVSSLVGLQANALSDQVAKDALAETQARIYAIALVHKRLYTSGDVSVVEIDEYLDGLLEHLGDSMRMDGHSAILSHALAALPVPTDLALNLGVVVTELVTNAFKYAYPSGGAGEIRVRLQQLQDSEIELLVEDDGAGWDGSGKPKGSGLGTRIVQAMTTSLAAKVDYINRQPGTTARLRFVLPS